jgi:WD40 repeat protein
MTARVWDAQSGRELVALRGYVGKVTSAQFTPDARRIITASDDGTTRIHFVYVEDLIALAKKRAGRELTPEERETFLRVEGDELLLPNP